MNSYLQYLLNVSFSILPFYLLYLLCFRRLTFFTLNRWYILGSLIISALIPLISFQSGAQQYLPVQHLPFLPQPAIAPALQSVSPASSTPATMNWPQLLMIIYTGGVAVATTSLLASLSRVTSLLRSNSSEYVAGYYIIKNSRVALNASFFRYIFIQPALSIEEEATVVLHESVHARKWHTFDVLLLECFKILLWFHPALYHYKKLLQQAHEFEVDQVAALGVGKKPYAHLLLKIQSTCTSPLTNGYSSSGITQRIKMLFTERSKSPMKIFYLLVIPCLMIIAIYCSKKPAGAQIHPVKKQVAIEAVIPVNNNLLIKTGKELFLANCAACHAVEKDLTGPALSGIENRRTKEWLYQFIRNNMDLLKAGDSTAVKLYNDWGKTPMNIFPNLSNKDIDAMLAYIRAAE